MKAGLDLFAVHLATSTTNFIRSRLAAESYTTSTLERVLFCVNGEHLPPSFTAIEDKKPQLASRALHGLPLLI